jgi:4-hydroxy-tetrahydrodipicolinate reductase
MIKNPHFVVVGQGNMAGLIHRKCQENSVGYTLVKELPFPDETPENSVVFHVGSGRLFDQTLEFCQKHSVPIIQASSSGVTLPPTDHVKVAIIDSPNLGLAIAAHLLAFEQLLGPMMQTLDVKATVTESHQSTKTSAPITAQKFAASLGCPPEGVVSIRNRELQKDVLKVPDEYLDGHAYHFIEMEACGIKISTAIKIHGRDPYFYGGLAVGRKLVQLKECNELMPGIQSVSEFMF